jgi:hypothetical protein
VVQQGAYLSREFITAQLSRLQERLNKTMERKMRSIVLTRTMERKSCDYTQVLGVYPFQEQAEHGTQGRRASTQPFR